MPFVDPDDSPRHAPQPVIQQIAKPNYSGITIDTKVEPVENLLSHIEGSSWTVLYFSQVLDTDSEAMGQNQTVSGVHQQYRKIKFLELKVSSELQTSQDPQTKQMTHRGAAHVYPFFIPNSGDMFIADVGDGREGIFEIVNVERKSVFKRAVHSIEYRMVDYVNDVRRADLEKKSVQTLVYDRDMLQYGVNALLFEEEYELKKYINRSYKEQLKRYFKAFYSREFSTMAIPGQMPYVYDPFIVKALLACFEVLDAEEIQHIKALNIEDDLALKATSVWDAIRSRDLVTLSDSFTQWGTVETVQFAREPHLNSIRYSGFGTVLYPMDPTVTVDYIRFDNPRAPLVYDLQEAPQQMRGGVLDLLPTPLKRLSDAFTTNVVANGFVATADDLPSLPPLIHRAMSTGTYIFSNSFYQGDKTMMSQLERQVYTYLEGEKVSPKYIKLLIQDIPNWTAMDRFYFTPVLLMLMQSVIRDF